MANWYRFAQMGVAFSLLSACGSWDGLESEERTEELGTASSPIINGMVQSSNRWGLAAIYRLRNGQWRFAGTGRVLNPHSYRKAVLTARHAVTVRNGDVPPPIGGPTVDPSERLVTALPAPGFEPANTSSDFQVADAIYPAANTTDLAIIWVEGDIGLSTTYSVGLSLAPIDPLVGEYVDHYGYGIDGDDDTSGILRKGASFRVTDTYADGVYRYHNRSVSSPVRIVASGDSGGPAMVEARPSPNVDRTYQVGVHSLANMTCKPDNDYAGCWGEDPSIAGNWGWIQAVLGYVYLRSANTYDERVTWANTWRQTYPTMEANAGDDWHSKLRYDPSNKRLEVFGWRGAPSGRCIALKYNNVTEGTPFWLESCANSLAQRFVVTADMQIKLQAYNRCIEAASDGYLRSRACAITPRQTWQFDYDPGPS